MIKEIKNNLLQVNLLNQSIIELLVEKTKSEITRQIHIKTTIF